MRRRAHRIPAETIALAFAGLFESLDGCCDLFSRRKRYRSKPAIRQQKDREQADGRRLFHRQQKSGVSSCHVAIAPIAISRTIDGSDCLKFGKCFPGRGARAAWIQDAAAAEKYEAIAVAAQRGNKVGGIESARRWSRGPHHHTLGDTEFLHASDTLLHRLVENPLLPRRPDACERRCGMYAARLAYLATRLDRTGPSGR
jgi:hypothetical protein